MKSKRKKIPENTQLSLYAQVDGLCPRCQRSLLYEKASQLRKEYEIAHIYPLSPSEDEKNILLGVELLSEDLNHEDNLIPLCTGCHTKFDKPRTKEDYLDLLRIKKDCINKAKQRNLWGAHPLESDIYKVIDSLCKLDSHEFDDKPNMDAKKVEEKINKEESLIFTNKIRTHVSEYYTFIRKQFILCDSIKPGAADVIAAQIKTYYKLQKMMGGGQQEIYRNISDWIYVKTRQINFEAAEILTSFFVQNCEVFE